jgi:hypothetical protein
MTFLSITQTITDGINGVFMVLILCVLPIAAVSTAIFQHIAWNNPYNIAGYPTQGVRFGAPLRDRLLAILGLIIIAIVVLLVVLLKYA